MQFDHERLDVYKVAMQFAVLTAKIMDALPQGKRYIADQIGRASLSIGLNIAEGAGEFSPAEKARFYRMAKRSATECAAILEICRELMLIEDNLLTEGREMLIKIVSMMIKLIKSVESK